MEVASPLSLVTHQGKGRKSNYFATETIMFKVARWRITLEMPKPSEREREILRLVTLGQRIFNQL